MNSADLIIADELELPPGLLQTRIKPENSRKISSRRLGLQFEELVRTCLELNPQITDIESNIPIRNEGITLGEADLLFRRASEHWHVELALKFYLREQNSAGLSGYYGPNRKDRFDIKYRHMVEHQSRILHSQAALPTLKQRGIEALRTAMLVKGWLFQHPDDQRTDYPAPINPHHARGWWIHQSELATWIASQPACADYLLVEKPYWLYPVNRVKAPKRNRQQLIAEIKRRSSAVQVWIVLGEGYSRQLLSRGYVVPDNWEQSS